MSVLAGEGPAVKRWPTGRKARGSKDTPEGAPANDPQAVPPQGGAQAEKAWLPS